MLEPIVEMAHLVNPSHCTHPMHSNPHLWLSNATHRPPDTKGPVGANAMRAGYIEHTILIKHAEEGLLVDLQAGYKKWPRPRRSLGLGLAKGLMPCKIASPPAKLIEENVGRSERRARSAAAKGTLQPLDKPALNRYSFSSLARH